MPLPITKKIKLYNLPPGDKYNQYFLLLERGLLKLGDGQIILSPLPRFGLWGLLVSPSPAAKVIINVHWSTVLYGSQYWLFALVRFVSNFTALSLIKITRRAHLGWTVHNHFAHDFPYPRLDRWGRFCLASLADFIILQQESILPQWQARYPRKKIFFSPHGHYLGAYGELATIESVNQLRTKLGLAPTDRVILSLGMIRPYKKLDRLIAVFNELDKTLAPVYKLLIVGRGEREYTTALEKQINNPERVRIINQFIPNAELSIWLGLGHSALYYYDQSELSSGALILSLSYGLPVICRDIPAAELIKNGVNGATFTTEEELKKILLADQLAVRPAPSIVRATISNLTWEQSAAKLISVYQQL